MDRLVALKDVGDFRTGDVLPYTDPIDINILTTLGVAKLERPAPEDPVPDDDNDDDDVEELILGTNYDRPVVFAENPNPVPDAPDEPNTPDQPVKAQMENPNPTPDDESDKPAEPAEEPNEPRTPVGIKTSDDWSGNEEFAKRRGMRPEQGVRPKDPEEYRTRVMNDERTHNKKRRRTRTPK